MLPVRLVLRGPPADLIALRLWFYENRWNLAGFVEDDPEQVEIAWMRSAIETRVSYLDDERLGQVFFVVWGRQQRAVVETLRAAFDGVDPIEVLAAAPSAASDRAVQAIRAGLVATWPEHRARATEILVGASYAAEAEVRRAAARGMLWALDPARIPRLQALADGDPDPDVRRAAVDAIDELSLLDEIR